MKRRDFLRAASGAAGASAAVGTASAQSAAPVSQTDNGTAGNGTSNGTANGTGNGTGNGTTDSDGSPLPGSGTTKTVAVGPNNQNVFDPETVYIQPGATVEWVWESGGHNVVSYQDELPEEASWMGAVELHDEGYTYSHTFDILGEYPYYCEPHESVGMVGSVVVNESGQPPQSESGAINPEEMGVPFQAHFVGIATVVMMLVSLVYTFFAVKYGESRHASSPE